MVLLHSMATMRLSKRDTDQTRSRIAISPVYQNPVWGWAWVVNDQLRPDACNFLIVPVSPALTSTSTRLVTTTHNHRFTIINPFRLQLRNDTVVNRWQLTLRSALGMHMVPVVQVIDDPSLRCPLCMNAVHSKQFPPRATLTSLRSTARSKSNPKLPI